MKCAVHLDANSVAMCHGCGIGLCSDCSKRFNAIICEDCLIKHNKSINTEMYAGLVLTAVLLLPAMARIVTIILGHGPSTTIMEFLFLGILPAFTVWGWKFLSDRQTLSFIGNGRAWLVYFGVKLCIAYVIGIVVGPYQIYNCLKQISAVKKTKNQLAQGEI